MKIRMLIVLFITMILLGSFSNSHDVYLNEENKISLFFDHKAISDQETIKKGFFNLFFRNKFNKNKKILLSTEILGYMHFSQKLNGQI